MELFIFVFFFRNKFDKNRLYSIVLVRDRCLRVSLKVSALTVRNYDGLIRVVSVFTQRLSRVKQEFVATIDQFVWEVPEVLFNLARKYI